MVAPASPQIPAAIDDVVLAGAGAAVVDRQEEHDPGDVVRHEPALEALAPHITEDITTELSRFSELLVIARNSSFQYKGKAVDIRQLGARCVVEGSVRRGGERIRITSQFIEAVTGAHRWGKRYDRELRTSSRSRTRWRARFSQSSRLI